MIEKLRKFDVPKPPPETYDPEILTKEERHYMKRTGERKKTLYSSWETRSVWWGSS